MISVGSNSWCLLGDCKKVDETGGFPYWSERTFLVFSCIDSNFMFQILRWATTVNCSYLPVLQVSVWRSRDIWFPTMWHFDNVDSNEPVQPPFRLKTLKWCSISSLTLKEYSSDKQRLWSDCRYAQADLRLCWSHIPHCWKSHALAQTIKLVLSIGAKNHCWFIYWKRYFNWLLMYKQELIMLRKHNIRT